MAIPNYKLTIGTFESSDSIFSCKIVRNENGFDSATITFDNTVYYPNTVTESSPIQLEVKDYSDPTYTTIFKGAVRFATPNISGDKKQLALSCLGSGYGLAEMLVGTEYGSESFNPTINTLAEIVININSMYLNKILGSADDSGFSYTNSCTLANSIPYISFPYKPVDKCLNDLMDLVAAQEAGAAGPHWIVTTDDVLHVHTVGASQTGWSKYLGGTTNTDGQATLTYGEDYTSINLEKMSPEANYIIYYGNWRRPSNGDSWTEATTAGWGTSDVTLSIDSTQHIVGDASLKASSDNTSPNTFYYPSSKDAGWDLSFAGSTQYIPTLNFYVSRAQNLNALSVSLFTSAGNYFATENFGYGSPVLYLEDIDKFYHFSIPIGQNWREAANTSNLHWTLGSGNPSWTDINWIEFRLYTPFANQYINLDGLHLGGVPICRVAWNSDLPGGKAKMRLITDNIGKDDTLLYGTPGTTDTGLMAQLAYSELLRLQKTSLVGTVQTPMIKDLLPGQFLNIQGTDFRTTKVIHNFDGKTWFSIIDITDDVTNSRTRPRYEDLNKQWANVRPEFQDRQAASIKAGSVDINIQRLVEDYAP